MFSCILVHLSTAFTCIYNNIPKDVLVSVYMLPVCLGSHTGVQTAWWKSVGHLRHAVCWYSLCWHWIFFSLTCMWSSENALCISMLYMLQRVVCSRPFLQFLDFLTSWSKRAEGGSFLWKHVHVRSSLAVVHGYKSLGSLWHGTIWYQTHGTSLRQMLKSPIKC